MTIYLTAGAVEKLANGEIPMMSVLHVLKSMIVEAMQCEAAVLSLTDGPGHEIRAILRGDLTTLVKRKIVASGSNVQLLQFTTIVLQGRRFVAIRAMKVILSSSDVIGQPHSDVIGQPQGHQQNFDVELTSSDSKYVPNTQESNSVKTLVADELKIFHDRIKDAKAFVCDTRTTKDGIWAAIRCFDMIITKFNKLLSDLCVPPKEPRAFPSNDDSEELYMDQLRLNASSLIQLFMKWIVPQLLKLFRSTTYVPELNKIQSVVDGCSISVYRLTTEGFNCKKDEDKDFEWFL